MYSNNLVSNNGYYPKFLRNNNKRLTSNQCCLFTNLLQQDDKCCKEKSHTKSKNKISLTKSKKKQALTPTKFLKVKQKHLNHIRKKSLKQLKDSIDNKQPTITQRNNKKIINNQQQHQKQHQRQKQFQYKYYCNVPNKSKFYYHNSNKSQLLKLRESLSSFNLKRQKQRNSIHYQSINRISNHLNIENIGQKTYQRQQQIKKIKYGGKQYKERKLNNIKINYLYPTSRIIVQSPQKSPHFNQNNQKTSDNKSFQSMIKSNNNLNNIQKSNFSFFMGKQTISSRISQEQNLIQFSLIEQRNGNMFKSAIVGSGSIERKLNKYISAKQPYIGSETNKFSKSPQSKLTKLTLGSVIFNQND